VRSFLKVIDKVVSGESKVIGTVNRTIGILGFIALMIGLPIVAFVYSIEALLFTTFITLSFLLLVFAFNFKNRILNTIACIPFIWFILIPDWHMILGIIQFLIIISKAKFSEKGLMFGFVFFLTFLFVYDDAYRVMELFPFLSKKEFMIAVFYTLVLSCVIIYKIKQYREVI